MQFFDEFWTIAKDALYAIVDSRSETGGPEDARKGRHAVMKRIPDLQVAIEREARRIITGG
jgi:hypothetical protein